METFQQKIEFVSIIKKKNVTLFEEFLAFLDRSMKTPIGFGWFHLLCLMIIVSLCIFTVLKARNISDKAFNRTLGITAGILLLLEVYKQLNFSYDSTNDLWRYQWYAFPFQFCSTPMYVMLAAALIPQEKIRKSLHAFLATYTLFAGCAVMLYPNDVFISTIGINIQTMVHHGMMVVIGIFMYASGRVKYSHKMIQHALPTFITLISLALTANIIYGKFGDPEQTFNMFFISPYYTCTLPVLSLVYGKVPYLVFLSCYIIGFSAAAYLTSLLVLVTEIFYTKIKNKWYKVKRA